MWHAGERGENCIVFWWESTEGKRPLERPRRRWEDGIKMYLKEIGWGGCGVDSPGSGQGPLAGCCECGDEPSGSGATQLVPESVKNRQVPAGTYM
jgi:hypothetical protein